MNFAIVPNLNIVFGTFGVLTTKNDARTMKVVIVGELAHTDGMLRAGKDNSFQGPYLRLSQLGS